MDIVTLEIYIPEFALKSVHTAYTVVQGAQLKTNKKLNILNPVHMSERYKLHFNGAKQDDPIGSNIL